MSSAKNILKQLVLNTCPPRVQRAIRRYYKVREVLRGTDEHEPEFEAVRSFTLPGDCVADVGANYGSYTKLLSSLVGTEGRVFSFEPIPENFEILEAIVRRAPLSNVRCFQAALGSKSGQREMVIPNAEGYQGLYLAHFARPQDSGQLKNVRVLTLDGLFEDKTIRTLDFVKCDVEGAELEVLEGAQRLMRWSRLGWFLEIKLRTSVEVFRLFTGLGYQAFVYTGKLLPTREYRNKEFSNYFFFHPNSKLWNRVVPLMST